MWGSREKKCPEKCCKTNYYGGQQIQDLERTIMMLKLPSDSLEKITGTGIRKHYLRLQMLTYTYGSRVMK